MRGYFGLGQLSAADKQDILNQHKSVYNGYQTMQPQVSNTQQLYVYDDISDKNGFVVNNKGEVKKYTNMGINEQVEMNEVCDECGAMIMDGMCTECNYGHMEEVYTEGSKMCEQCGGTMKEDVCEQCTMEEGVGHLDDIYHEEDLNPTAGFDYVTGSSNDEDTFEGMHKNLYKEQDDDDFEDYESSYTEDGVDDPDNEDDGFEDMNSSEVTDGELGEYAADDMDVSDVEPAYDFESNGPMAGGDVYPVNEYDEELDEGDMYAYEPEKMYEFDEMESAWADEELEEQPDISGVQGIYGDMDRAYDFTSDGPGKAGPYQEFSYESELDEDEEFTSTEDDFEEVDEDLKESFMGQRNRIIEMFNRFGKYN